MRTSDERLFGKRMLVEISHAIERFALAADRGSPLVVIAMFQKLSYFRREADVYRAIAATGAVTLVGMAEEFPPELPPGVRHALLGAHDPLAREWSVSVLGPKGGATLVATDLEEIDPRARTLEEGRRFRGQWSFRRTDAYAEVLRLRSRLALGPDTREAIDGVLRTVLDEPEPLRQDWWDVPLQFLGERMNSALRDRAAAAAALEAARDDTSERDPRTGLYTPAFLQRWTAGMGGGTLPVGLILLRVFGVADLRRRYGLRAEHAALQGLRDGIGTLVRDTDRVIRVGREDFLVVLPGWKDEDVLTLCDAVCARVAALDQVYPFVALPSSAATTVTRERPLPVDQLVHQVALAPV